MKAQVDHDLCEGHGKCAQAAPEVFDFRPEEEQSYVKLEDIGPELKDKVDRAIRLCPRQAVSWVTQS